MIKIILNQKKLLKYKSYTSTGQLHVTFTFKGLSGFEWACINV